MVRLELLAATSSKAWHFNHTLWSINPGKSVICSSNLTVKKGDVITVTNTDTAPHTVTSGATPDDPQNAKSFDSSIIMPGKTAKINTSTLAPGDYPFHCTVHPYMKGTLTVKA